jgi:hypothetical protein
MVAGGIALLWITLAGFAWTWGALVNRYQLVRDGGQTYRLDRLTGKILVVSADGAWPVEMLKEKPLAPITPLRSNL